MFAPGGRVLRAGEPFRDADLADTIERFGAEGAAPFYEGDIGAAIVAWLARARRPARRAPTSPPTRRSRASRCARATAAARSSRTRRRRPAGRCSRSRWRASTRDGRPAVGAARSSTSWRRSRRSARPSSSRASPSPASPSRFLASRLGSTTHISVHRRRGPRVQRDLHERRGLGRRRARHRHPPEQHHGRAGPQPARLLPLPAGPADAVDDGPDRRAATTARSSSCSAARARTGSARRSCRSIVDAVDHGLRARAAVDAPRVHFEDGVVYAEPGDRPRRAARRPGATSSRSARRNLFFGGVQAVERDPATGALSGAGDPRRGGVAVAVSRRPARGSRARSSGAALAGCGGGTGPDLFIVQRGGSIPGARLTLRVTDEGRARATVARWSTSRARS